MLFKDFDYNVTLRHRQKRDDDAPKKVFERGNTSIKGFQFCLEFFDIFMFFKFIYDQTSSETT
jgi:hypothetical protein